MPGKVRPVSRPLTAPERAAIERLLALGTTRPESAPAAAQVRDVRVVGECTCGCGTIDLAVGATRPGQVPIPGPSVVFDGVARDVDGGLVDLILRVRGGKLAELEVYRPDGARLAGPLPDASAIGPSPLRT